MTFPAKEFARVVFPGGQPGVFLMLKAYFDDSGTHRNSEVVVWAGVAAPVDRFDKFEAAWAEMLAEPLPGKPPIKAFSLGDCRWHNKEFETYKEAESDALRYRVREIIKKSRLRSIAFCIPLKFWNKLPPRISRAYGGADAVAFASCADWAIQVSAGLDKIPLACVFDKGQSKRILDLHIEDAERRAAEAEIPISYSFGAVADHYGLQAADTMATQHYWQSLQWSHEGYFPPTDPHYLSLQKMNAPIGLVLGPKDIERMKRDFLKAHPTSDYLRKTQKERMFYRPGWLEG